MRKNQFAHSLFAATRFLLTILTLGIAMPLYLTVRPARADVAVGTSTGDFLGFEVGASSAGLGGANTSVASGATSQFWNPALLAGMNHPQASVMHATWLTNLEYEWMGYARPMGEKSGVGSLSVAYFHMPSISGVDEFDNPTGDFHVYDMAVTLGYSRTLVKGIALGANGKLIRQTLATVSGTGGAVDLGMSASLAGATLGATVQNLGPDLSMGGGTYPLPQVVRFGLSRPFVSNRVLLAVDYSMPKTYYDDVRFGAEIRPNSFLAVRGGYRYVAGSTDDPSTGFSFGLGAHYGPIAIDYAMTPDNGFSDVHRLSFGYTFGGGPERPTKPEPKPEPARPPTPKGPPVIAAAPTPTPAPKKAAQPVPAPKSDTAIAQTPPSPTPKSSATQYEVVLGDYTTETSAQSELAALRILGFQLKDAKVTLVPGSGYRLSLVRYNGRKQADDLAASLVALSFSPKVEITRR